MAPAWEGCQGAGSALVSRETAVPLSPRCALAMVRGANFGYLGTLLVMIAAIKRPPGKNKNYPEASRIYWQPTKQNPGRQVLCLLLSFSRVLCSGCLGGCILGCTGFWPLMLPRCARGVTTPSCKQFISTSAHTRPVPTSALTHPSRRAPPPPSARHRAQSCNCEQWGRIHKNATPPPPHPSPP